MFLSHHVLCHAPGYELSWFFNPFFPNYWENIGVEHGYSRCTVHPHLKHLKSRQCLQCLPFVMPMETVCSTWNGSF